MFLDARNGALDGPDADPATRLLFIYNFKLIAIDGIYITALLFDQCHVSAAHFTMKSEYRTPSASSAWPVLPDQLTQAVYPTHPPESQLIML